MEYGYVRLHAIPQYASVRQADALRREGCHFAYCFRQCHLVLLPHIFGKNDGEASIGAWAGKVSQQHGVTADHRQWMADKSGQCVAVRAIRHIAGLQVFFEQQVAYSINRMLVPHGCDCLDGQALIDMVVRLFEVRKPHIVPRGSARLHLPPQALSRILGCQRLLQRANAAVVRPVWHHNQQARTSEHIRVAVECHILSAVGGIFNKTD